MLQLRRQKGCVCVTEKSWSLSTSSLHYDVKKNIFSEFETDLPLFFSKREHWLFLLCVCVCVCVCLCSVAQLCPTLCNPMDCSLPGSSIHEILPARTLEWVAISFSRRSSQLKDQTHISYTPALQVESLLLSDQGNLLLFKFPCLSLVSAKR